MQSAALLTAIPTAIPKKVDLLNLPWKIRNALYTKVLSGEEMLYRLGVVVSEEVPPGLANSKEIFQVIYKAMAQIPEIMAFPPEKIAALPLVAQVAWDKLCLDQEGPLPVLKDIKAPAVLVPLSSSAQLAKVLQSVPAENAVPVLPPIKDSKAATPVRKKLVEELPVFSAEEMVLVKSEWPNLVDDKHARVDLRPHGDAQVIAQGLYQLGALLMNHDLAYTAAGVKEAINKNIFKSMETVSAKYIKKTPTSPTMELYNKVPEYAAIFGQYRQNNPFQAIFVMAVALDHLPPPTVVHLYRQLVEGGQKMTSAISPIIFPNGSGFFGGHAILGVLHYYIINRPLQFSPKTVPTIDKIVLEIATRKLIGDSDDNLKIMKMLSQTIGPAKGAALFPATSPALKPPAGTAEIGASSFALR